MLQAILDTNVDALAVHDAARTDTGPSVILKPIVRPGPTEAGWFGGKPMLPTDVAWPEIDGVPLNFLAQIDLTKVPTNIWSGLGPRNGHLVFFNHPRGCGGKVLHVSGNLSLRSADVPIPHHRLNHDDSGPTPRFPYFNRFAVSAIENEGQLPAQTLSTRLRRDKELLDFGKPEHRPFDTASLGFLIERISADIDMRLAQCDHQIKGGLQEKAMTTVLSIQDEAIKTRKAFDAAAHAVQTQSFDLDRVSCFIEDISALSLTGLNVTHGAGGKVVDIEPAAVMLVDPEKSDCANMYLFMLDEHLFQCFVEDRDALAPPQRDRIERKCVDMADTELGGMSHAPHGFIYTPHGRGSPNEVLLELPSSRLNGWVWGDAYTLVFLINRRALKRGKFDKMELDITN
ncbi:hypothetical protein GCM10007385_39390 [Tateyamaria omphalii]|nr:hypothetical protein GCM10007385_39390 [Tateyamaria omphalii]